MSCVCSFCQLMYTFSAGPVCCIAFRVDWSVQWRPVMRYGMQNCLYLAHCIYFSLPQYMYTVYYCSDVNLSAVYTSAVQYSRLGRQGNCRHCIDLQVHVRPKYCRSCRHRRGRGEYWVEGCTDLRRVQGCSKDTCCYALLGSGEVQVRWRLDVKRAACAGGFAGISISQAHVNTRCSAGTG